MNSLPNQIDIIQGGMGVGVSSWELAGAVASAEPTENGEVAMGVTSGTATDVMLARRIQDHDTDIIEALEAFPSTEAVRRVKKMYLRPSPREYGEPYKITPKFQIEGTPQIAIDLNTIGAFADVWLAKRKSNNGPVGMNLLTKLEEPTISAIHGAILAEVDAITMGAGVPRQIPGILGNLSMHRAVEMEIKVLKSGDERYSMAYNPALYVGEGELKRPAFFAIVSHQDLVKSLQSQESRPDGYIVEGHTAGGHNAPARGTVRDSIGQPVYDERDKADLGAIRDMGVRFWLAGGFDSPAAYRYAKVAGAEGIQTGSLFALTEESGIDTAIKDYLTDQILNNGGVDIVTTNISPTGFPFKVADVPGSLSNQEVLRDRKPVCDLGFLRERVKGSAGQVEYRCTAEPAASYKRKGGLEFRQKGKGCLCNALLATAGLAQVRRLPSGEKSLEPTLVTLGDGINEALPPAVEFAELPLTARGVVSYLRSQP